ncbi:hypothetical protein DL96DRAFT_1115418 [Flagelloscypha sp. PMI_526]|nr:hypothetical protein DL96DRAFT_1115418 [Flagelloscypha sp. PMI_526]
MKALVLKALRKLHLVKAQPSSLFDPSLSLEVPTTSIKTLPQHEQFPSTVSSTFAIDSHSVRSVPLVSLVESTSEPYKSDLSTRVHNTLGTTPQASKHVNASEVFGEAKISIMMQLRKIEPSALTQSMSHAEAVHYILRTILPMAQAWNQQEELLNATIAPDTPLGGSQTSVSPGDGDPPESRLSSVSCVDLLAQLPAPRNGSTKSQTDLHDISRAVLLAETGSSDDLSRGVGHHYTWPNKYKRAGPPLAMFKESPTFLPRYFQYHPEFSHTAKAGDPLHWSPILPDAPFLHNTKDDIGVDFEDFKEGMSEAAQKLLEGLLRMKDVLPCQENPEGFKSFPPGYFEPSFLLLEKRVKVYQNLSKKELTDMLDVLLVIAESFFRDTMGFLQMEGFSPEAFTL